MSIDKWDHSLFGKVIPYQCELLRCSIGGANFIDTKTLMTNFHVQELRIYEDNCKFYFTGQLVIEAQQNVFEMYLFPQAEVVISFSAPPNNKVYTEVFRVYSYESKPRKGDLENSMIITISLIGDEYFKDKSQQVQMNFANETATQAAKKIHTSKIAINGSIEVPQDSIGVIGQQYHHHQVLSKQPSKAIYDLLDKAIFPVEHHGPGIYFRNYPGYVIASLEHLIKTAPITAHFMHVPAEGESFGTTFTSFFNIGNFRPMSPPGEDRGGARSHEFMGKGKTQSFIDLAEGNSKTSKGEGGSGYGSGVQKNATDSLRQPQTIDKQGPGNYQSKEDQFLSQLSYSQKYWLSVPLQGGLEVTVGDRIKVSYPVAGAIFEKTLWVARLIHELRFTEGDNRQQVSINGTTDLFAVHYVG